MALRLTLAAALTLLTGSVSRLDAGDRPTVPTMSTTRVAAVSVGEPEPLALQRRSRIAAKKIRKSRLSTHVGTTTSWSRSHAWAESAFARMVRSCESGGDYTEVDVHSGVTYYGAWQANADFWLTYGGPARYLSTRPFAAPRWLQDLVAYRGWRDRGWQPWQCASEVG